MFRIQVKLGLKWKWGLHDYTLEQAVFRLQALKDEGITARIAPVSRLFN